MPTPREAKKIIADILAANGRVHSLTARTVSFEDLARGARVFVKVHAWTPDPLADVLVTEARAHGFSVEFN